MGVDDVPSLMYVVKLFKLVCKFSSENENEKASFLKKNIFLPTFASLLPGKIMHGVGSQKGQFVLVH